MPAAIPKLRPVNPSTTPLPKPAANIPAIAKVKAPKQPKPVSQAALSPLFGQKKSRPVIQSVPTRTPSF